MHLVFRVQAADISIHALREEGDLETMAFHSSGRISIHALREEGDEDLYGHDRWMADFYPRPPRGGRLYADDAIVEQCCISIHALREEGDLQVVSQSDKAR